jgi:2-methylcitrate dehydratase PrpD
MIERTEKLAKFCAETTFSQLDFQVVERTKLIISDTIGAILGGIVEPEVREFLKFRAGQKSKDRKVKIIGLNKWAEQSDASLIHGIAGTTLEMDEGNQFAKGHPAIHVLPALVSVVQSRLLPQNISGQEFLNAFAIGYDVGARIGLASQLNPHMHPHGTWGVIGAASAIGVLLKFGHREHMQLMNISSSLTTASSRKTMLQGGTVRNVYAGLSNQMAHLAIDLIQSGFTGEVDGIGSIFGNVVSENLNDNLLLEKLGQRFEVMRNYFKLHACCRFNHAALDCLHDLMRDHQELSNIEQISFIDVESYNLAAELNDPRPQNMLAAKFSVPFALATTLVNKNSQVLSFAGGALKNEKTMALSNKVSVKEISSMTEMLPEFRPAKVTIGMKSGKVFRHSVKTNKGDWQSPYSADELENKFHSLANRSLSQKKSKVLYDKLQNLERIADMRELFQSI